MAPCVNRIYDRAFFERYGVTNPDYARACRTIARELVRRFGPKTAVDWGCGAGLHAVAMMNLGVEVTAVDAVHPDPDLVEPGVEIRVADLREPAGASLVPGAYDLSLCIDVMEHIEEEHADVALRNITGGARLLVLSAAPPHQGGHHHVNEQPRRYWIAKLRELGWHYDRYATGGLERHFLGRRDELPQTWMFHNLCVYRPHPVARPPGRPRRTGGRRR